MVYLGCGERELWGESYIHELIYCECREPGFEIWGYVLVPNKRRQKIAYLFIYYAHTCFYLFIFISLQRERERERSKGGGAGGGLSLYSH